MNYHTIFTVVSEHSASTVAARYAMAMAAAGRARLVLYAAHGEKTGETLLHRTERHLDHLETTALDLGLTVTRISETGLLTQLLPKRVMVEGADLVFYPLYPGERYGSGSRNLAVHQLLRTIGADLAIMRIMHMAKPHPRHILVPLGGVVKDRTQRVRFLAALAESFYAKVTLFHRSSAGTSGSTQDIALLCRELQQQHLEVLERSATGKIARAITLEAISRHNDLIVLGASERSSLRRLFLENPASDVMRHPPCNAILFRAAPASS